MTAEQPLGRARSVLPLLSWPGIRTLRSARFRLVVGLVLWIGGSLVIGAVLVSVADDPAAGFGTDFADYHVAAQRMAAGATPYAAEMFDGPVAAQGQDRYRYPPVFAQLLAPLAALSVGSAAAAWVLLQAAAILASVWIALRLSTGRLTPERVVWGGVAGTFFLPACDALWKGNVSGIQALQVAVLAAAGAAGGASLATGIVLKLTPITALPAALVVAAPHRARARLLVGIAAGAAAVTVPSLILAPDAWRDYATIVPNLLAGHADYHTNLAPGALIANHVGGGVALASVVRLIALAAAGVAIVAAVVAARRQGGWHAAVALAAVAMLLLPAALWYHYLIVLLPVAALAWPRASGWTRLAAVVGALLVVVGVAWLPVAFAGAVLMAGAAVIALWPRRHPLALAR